MPVIQTPGRTQQVVNTHVQHVVNAVKAEKPKISELTVQRKKPIIQEKMNQVTKPIKIPQVQFLTKVDDMPVVVQRQMSTAQTVQKAMEVPLLQFTDKVVDNPVVVHRQISTETVQKTMETPQSQCIDEMIDVPVVSVVQVPRACVVKKTVENPQFQTVEKSAEDPQTQTIHGAQTSEKLGTAPVCRSTQAEIVEAVEIEVPLPAESASPMSVTEPVLEVPPIVGKIDEIPEIRTDVGTQTSESSGTHLSKIRKRPC